MSLLDPLVAGLVCTGQVNGGGCIASDHLAGLSELTGVG